MPPGADNPDIKHLAFERLCSIAESCELGTLRSAQPTVGGTSAATLVLNTDRGDFILRAHRNDATLRREAIHAQLINEHTELAAAQAVFLDSSCSIIPQPYAVLPRLPGKSAADRALWKRLDERGRSELTRAFGAALRRLHNLHADTPGCFPGDDGRFEPFPDGFTHWQLGRTKHLLSLWSEHCPSVSREDIRWARTIVDSGVEHLTTNFQPVFVHHDYTLGNVLVQRVDGRMTVTGVIDLVEAYFALFEADLVRTVAMFGLSHPHRVEEFFDGYFGRQRPDPGHQQRFELFMLEDRLSVWLTDLGNRNHRLPSSFRSYAEPYIRLRPFSKMA